MERSEHAPPSPARPLAEYPEILTTSEVADVLRLTNRGVGQLVDGNVLTPIPSVPASGHSYRFRRADVAKVAGLFNPNERQNI
jgi:hypothetical protein